MKREMYSTVRFALMIIGFSIVAILLYPSRHFHEGGVARALSDEPRKLRAKVLDSVQTKAVLALVCGPPPEGRSARTPARSIAG
jgi:hypothetical protein